MSRPLRAFVPGGFYHLTTRGNNGSAIFADDLDRNRFLALLGAMVSRFSLDLHAWCLMSNHYHLVLQAHSGAVSAALHFLNGRYSQRFNERHGRTGHLFGGRFRTTYLEDEEHFWRSCHYAYDNPVRAGLVARASDWPWSALSAAVPPPP